MGLKGTLRVSHTDDGARSRPTVFFRLILAIPHLIWLTLWGIGAVLLLPVHWVAALILGRSMGWAHDFYANFVNLALAVHAYLYLAADRYPPFLGEGGYTVAAEIPAPVEQRRWTIALRLFLALPALVLAGALTSGVGGGSTGTGTGTSTDETAFSLNFGLALVLALMAWFASLAHGRIPQGLRDAQVYCLGYAAQAYAYFFLLSERYPTSDPRAVDLEPMPEHPVRVPHPEDDRSRDRLIVFFRLLLAIPHFIWLILWGLAAVAVALVGWFVAIAIGRLPEGWHRFVAGYVRYWGHVNSFVLVLGGPFPGFLGRPGSYPVDPEIAPPSEQSRWKIGFRLFLALPAFAIGSAFSNAMLFAAIGAWWAALIRGRVPEGLHRFLAWGLRYQVQLYSYVLLLTDRYPYTGPDGTGHSAEPDAEPSPEAWQLAPEAP